jgi:Mlc titration factor MtfA (ptsG expression regulator)
MLYIILFIGLLVVAVLGFSKLKSKKAASFPNHWLPVLDEEVLFYRRLSEENKSIFRHRMMLFLAEVHIDAVQTTLQDLDKILIASSAVIPVFGFKEWHYNRLSGIVLYPDTFNHDLEFAKTSENKQILGMVGSGQFENQMLLSRKALRKAFSNETDKFNTPIHEFVHLIDKEDHHIDGIPEAIMPKEYIEPWLELMYKEIDAIYKGESDIRSYATTNQAEFLAVTSEYFFERPALFKENHPELFEILERTFQQPKIK